MNNLHIDQNGKKFYYYEVNEQGSYIVTTPRPNSSATIIRKLREQEGINLSTTHTTTKEISPYLNSTKELIDKSTTVIDLQ
jgi:hypothetical protein